jgi:hypothetical protein
MSDSPTDGESRDVPVDWEALEDAFENNAPEVHSYLHIDTGEVLRVVDGIADPEMHARIASDTSYMRVDPVSSREQYRWMERFIPMVEDPELAEKLTRAIDGKGAFRRFKDVLLSYPVERDRWFQYRANLLHIYINHWLLAQDITLGESTPWGDPDQPPEPDIPLEKPIGNRGEGPTETLRRQARELVDDMPALELPSLIAYLRFLKEKSPSVADERPTGTED